MSTKRAPSIAETFDDHWIEDEETGCWNWQRACAGKGVAEGRGYGCFSVKGKLKSAHRFSWERENGPIPKGLILLHSCDNTKCVNPGHLAPGTNDQNQFDKAARELPMKNRKLSAEDVREIRRRVILGELQRIVGAEYGVCQSYVSQIMSRRYRFHVA